MKHHQNNCHWVIEVLIGIVVGEKSYDITIRAKMQFNEIQCNHFKFVWENIIFWRNYSHMIEGLSSPVILIG